ALGCTPSRSETGPGRLGAVSLYLKSSRSVQSGPWPNPTDTPSTGETSGSCDRSSLDLSTVPRARQRLLPCAHPDRTSEIAATMIGRISDREHRESPPSPYTVGRGCLFPNQTRPPSPSEK